MREKKSTGPILLVGSESDCPEIEYASGFRAPDPVLLLRTAEVQVLVVSRLEYGRARRCGARARLEKGCARGHEVLTPEELKVAPQRRGRLSEWARALLAREGVRRVTVPPFFPHGVAARLERAGIRVTVAEANLFPGRTIKDGDELRKIRESQQAAVIAMRAAVAHLAGTDINVRGQLVRGTAPVTSELVRRLIARTLLDHGCAARGTIVAGGEQSVDPHEAGTGPLMARQPIVIDIFPQHLDHGYWGDITRTVVRGAPSSSLRRMYQAVRAAQHAALLRVRPGVACSAVHAAAVGEFERRGYRTERVDGRPVGFIHSTGHGVGLAIHESPRVATNGDRLRRGQVITIEPGLYYPGLGGIRIEDTIAVTADGWRYLAPCEKRFEV